MEEGEEPPPAEEEDLEAHGVAQEDEDAPLDIEMRMEDLAWAVGSVGGAGGGAAAAPAGAAGSSGGKASSYKSVFFESKAKAGNRAWRGELSANGRQCRTPLYHTPEEAARAVDRCVR